MLTIGVVIGLTVVIVVVAFAAAVEWILDSFNENDIQE